MAIKASKPKTLLFHGSIANFKAPNLVSLLPKFAHLLSLLLIETFPLGCISIRVVDILPVWLLDHAKLRKKAVSQFDKWLSPRP